ncbi:MAG: DUF86 domain-containing protein [Desulfohalobiaceae bacterium]
MEQKIGRIQEYKDLLRRIQDECWQRFDTDPIYRGALLHYLYLMADSCITLAEMMIKHKSLRPPQTYSESFDILGDNRILEPEFAYSFARIAGFRNLLAHDYERVDGERICKGLLSSLQDVEHFVHQIQQEMG